MQLINQAGRTSLDEDLQLLARHAALTDRSFYAACQKIYLKVNICTQLFCLSKLSYTWERHLQGNVTGSMGVWDTFSICLSWTCSKRCGGQTEGWPIFLYVPFVKVTT